MKKTFLVLTSLIVASCAATPEKPQDDTAPLELKASSFSALPGWENDNFAGMAQAFSRSCGRIAKRDGEGLLGVEARFGKNKDWQVPCHNFTSINKDDPAAIRQFFENNFTPYQASGAANPEGLFTGYYEAGLNGSLTRTARYNVPLHARPDDLVMVDLGEFREELKGQRIAGRVKGGNLKPYETREQILAGKMPGDQEKILVWVDDAADAFFVQVQGSGVVQLTNGETMRIGYAGQNGHPYYAIGRELIKRGQLTKENVSMQAIRSWLAAHPNQADELMNTNKSYVFFRAVEEEGPVGGEGIALTPLRSLAIDHSKMPYGMPLWVDIDQAGNTDQKMRRLMMAQDTGGAIRGAVRGDVFWGFGAQAEAMAGAMKSQGRYWILLPKSLTQN